MGRLLPDSTQRLGFLPYRAWHRLFSSPHADGVSSRVGVPSKIGLPSVVAIVRVGPNPCCPFESARNVLARESTHGREQIPTSLVSRWVVAQADETSVTSFLECPRSADPGDERRYSRRSARIRTWIAGFGARQSAVDLPTHRPLIDSRAVLPLWLPSFLNQPCRTLLSSSRRRSPSGCW